MQTPAVSQFKKFFLYYVILDRDITSTECLDLDVYDDVICSR